MGSQFLKIVERWLRNQGVKKFPMESSPEAYQLYCNHGYIKMPFNDPNGLKDHPRDIEMGKDLCLNHS